MVVVGMSMKETFGSLFCGRNVVRADVMYVGQGFLKVGKCKQS